jgi:hypothetical protein
VRFLYATTPASTAMLTVKKVNISIVNTYGYIASDIVVSVVPINIVLLESEQNTSPVE